MHEFSLNRRWFAFGVAAAATASLVLPAEAICQAAAQGGPAAAPPTSLEQQAQAAMAKLSPQAQAEVEMKVSAILRKYGDKLAAEQKTDIRKVMAETQEGLEKMRAFSLDNGDQPAAVFRAYRAEGSK
jgi:hypothetical protein